MKLLVKYHEFGRRFNEKFLEMIGNQIEEMDRCGYTEGGGEMKRVHSLALFLFFDLNSDLNKCVFVLSFSKSQMVFNCFSAEQHYSHITMCTGRECEVRRSPAINNLCYRKPAAKYPWGLQWSLPLCSALLSHSASSLVVSCSTTCVILCEIWH